MDRALNPRLEKETIYEIYRACRLCGAGAGYKMPIIQNVIDLEDAELNLSQKIRECVQIEVHSDDKMPPLICELCVDKVNDFYEFLELCRHTNKQTRLKLGLPMQSTPKGVSDSGDCILGDTAPVYLNEDSDGEPLAKHRSKMKMKDIKENTRSKIKKEPGVKEKVKVVPKGDRNRASRRTSNHDATPPRITRTSCANDLNGRLRESHKKPISAPRSIIKREREDIKQEDDAPKPKRLRDKDMKNDVPAKKVKILIQQCPPKSINQAGPKSKTKPPARRPASPPARPASHGRRHASPARPQASPARHPAKQPAKEPAKQPAKQPAKNPTSAPRSNNSVAKRERSPASVPADQYTCKICSQTTPSSKGYHNHLRSHLVTFTKPQLACNACGEWFPTLEQANNHHKRHKYKYIPYKCRRCTGEFKAQQNYEDHFGKSQCVPYDEMPDVKCSECWRHFATDRLLIDHRCAGEEGRPGGKCSKCNRTYVLLKNLIRHESSCMHRSRSNLIADPEELARLRPLQIRVARCDPLLNKQIEGHYDVSNVRNFGFDPNCIYPYKKVNIKKEPFTGMVKIQEEVKKEFCSEEYVHWDSTDSEEEVPSLMTLSLKTIFSLKMLGRVPKKRRVKVEADEVLEDGGTVDLSTDVIDTDDNVKLGFKGFNDVLVNCEENGNIENGEENLEKYEELNKSDLKNSVDSRKDRVNEDEAKVDADRLDSIGDRDAENLKTNQIGDDTDKVNNLRINNEEPSENRTAHNGDELNVGDEVDDFGNADKLNGNDTNDSFEDIDGSKLIAALNAQIGEDDEPGDRSEDKGEDERHFKDINKDFAMKNDKLDSEKYEMKSDKTDSKENDFEIAYGKKQNEEINEYFNNTIRKEDTDSKETNTTYNVHKIDKLSERNGIDDHNDGRNGNCVLEKDKLSLEELLEKDLEKNMSLDNISDDDFNFDV